MTDSMIADDLIDDVLTEGLTHKVMVVFHLPERMPGWLVPLAMLVLALGAGLVWQYRTESGPVALAVTGMVLLFMWVDLLVLISLPRRNISFGPWKSQSLVLATPRFLATITIGLVAPWIGESTAVWLVALVQLGAAAALHWGAVVEPHRLQLTHLDVVCDRLPAGAPPLRILHISDLHVERITRREASVLDYVAQLQPDLVVMTGDYVNLSYNRDPETLGQVRQLLGRIEAPHGVFATMGSPPVDLRETVVPLFDGLPISLLRHDCQMVDLGCDRRLAILGLDVTHHLPTDRAHLAALRPAVPDDCVLLLLYHSPELMPEASQMGIDLYLCGHTHGGQVRLPLLGPILTSSQLGRRYVMGLYRHGRTHLYVSRGIGMEGMSAPRVRFLSPPEVTLVTVWPAELSNVVGATTPDNSRSRY